MKDKTSLYLLSIVGIVATVGIVVFILNNVGSSSTLSTSDISGQAISPSLKSSNILSLSKCTDSDGGIDSYYKGVSSSGTTEYEDVCLAETLNPISSYTSSLTEATFDFSATFSSGYAYSGVKEYYCNGNKVAYKYLSCKYGYCNTGACLTQGDAETYICTDTDDGNDPTTKGTITGGLWYSTGEPLSSNSDYCSGSILHEYYCFNEHIGYGTSTDCEAEVGIGSTCVEGACTIP